MKTTILALLLAASGFIQAPAQSSIGTLGGSAPRPPGWPSFTYNPPPTVISDFGTNEFRMAIMPYRNVTLDGRNVQVDSYEPIVVPEPGASLMIFTGVMLLAWSRFRRG